MLKWDNPQESFWLSAHLYLTGLSQSEEPPARAESRQQQQQKIVKNIYIQLYIFIEAGVWAPYCFV